MDPKLLHTITGLPGGCGIPVIAIDDDSFFFKTTCKTMTFRDEELIPNEEGKIIINIEPLNLPFYYGDAQVPKEFEFPKDVYEARAEKRKLKARAKDAIHISYEHSEPMYFYLEGDKLRILQGEKEVISDKIEIVYGRKAVKAESLELGHPYLELPTTVGYKFEHVLKDKELKSLKLIKAGTSVLDGKKYYGLNITLTEDRWKIVKGRFEWFDGENPFHGWLTADPGRVSEILGIPIQEN